MKRHTKIYLDYFKIYNPEEVMCELCGKIAVDIHHIDYRGMGGRNVDYIENLMALCRECHNNVHLYPKKYNKKLLILIHKSNLK